jgi:hypothetical protein
MRSASTGVNLAQEFDAFLLAYALEQWGCNPTSV